MSLILHIGSPKTGSTAIQLALLKGRKLLKARNICTIKKSKDRLGKCSGLSPHSLFQAVQSGGIPRSQRSRFSSEQEYRYYQSQQAEAAQLFLAKKSQQSMNLVVSDEYLFGIDCSSMERLRSIFQHANQDVSAVIAYVREPASLYLSWMQQSLKANYRVLDPCQWTFDYLRPLALWNSFFPGRLQVRPFNVEVMPGGSVVRDFSEQLGRAVGLARDSLVDLDSGELSNRSLSAESLLLLQRYQASFHRGDVGRFTPDGRRMLRLLRSLDAELGFERPRLLPEVRQKIVSRHAPQLQALARDYGIRFSAIPEENYAECSASVEVHALNAGHPVCLEHLIENLSQSRAEQLHLHCIHALLARSHWKS